MQKSWPPAPPATCHHSSRAFPLADLSCLDKSRILPCAKLQQNDAKRRVCDSSNQLQQKKRYNADKAKDRIWHAKFSSSRWYGCNRSHAAPCQEITGNEEKKILNTLIIDDNQMIRMLLRTIMNDAGYKVVGEASNGETGMELVTRLKPHIVFLDVMMPDSNGVELLKCILEKAPMTIVLMVTGKRDAETVQTSIQGGAKGFIIKPFNAGTVLDAVKGAVARAAAEREERLKAKTQAAQS
ncbi:response regulator [Massilia sp. W12]|uniref:response regulator n=1 Tax=Massilia sp. W12 TaxID=3126507 RepID=UPI0030D4DAB6